MKTSNGYLPSTHLFPSTRRLQPLPLPPHRRRSSNVMHANSLPAWMALLQTILNGARVFAEGHFRFRWCRQRSDGQRRTRRMPIFAPTYSGYKNPSLLLSTEQWESVGSLGCHHKEQETCYLAMPMHGICDGRMRSLRMQTVCVSCGLTVEKRSCLMTAADGGQLAGETPSSLYLRSQRP